MADSEQQQHLRKRARQACISCNARRVKCDVTEINPCSNCVASNVNCETRESRRGKHARPSKKRRHSEAVSSGSGYAQHADELAASHALTALSKESDRLNDARSNGLDIDEGNTMKPTLPIHSHHDARQQEDDNVYLGEASSLNHLAAGVRLRHAVPNFVKAEALIPQWEADRRRTRLEYLRAQASFSFPPPHIVEALIKAYFLWFHPCFAIVDEVDTWDQYRRGLLSPLLLQAILFIGCLHCDEPLLREIGFDSRHRAKYVFYNRAKDLYDVEFERKKITVIQALFLMSFWRAGALLEKDTRHWLGCAITLAQTKALHRAAGKAETQVAKLRKRIWWSLYTRDRQCAAALGLPDRVRDEDCDFEALELSDFDYAYDPSIPKEKTDEFASYAVTMAQLATLLGNIVHSGYLPNQGFSTVHRTQMKAQLATFQQRLPPRKQPAHIDLYQQSGFFSNMIHLAYNNLLILLYRHDYIQNDNGGSQEAADGNMVLQIASENCRIIEDMLAEGSLRHGQIHAITNLFNTLCIHAVHLRRAEGTTKSVAEHRAKLCLLGLQELQKTWEVTNWVLQLFFSYLDHSTAARLRMQEDNHLISTGVSSASLLSKQPTPGLQTPYGVDLSRRNTLPTILPEREHANMADVMQQPSIQPPWILPSEEANNFLFSQIEDQFAFGEGEVLNWSPEETAAINQAIFPSDFDGSYLS